MPIPASPVPQPVAPPPVPGAPVAPVQTVGAVPPPQTPTPAQLPPPISSVAAGELPAIRFPGEPRNRALSPLSQYVAQNLDTIARAGIDFLELPDKQSVLFNPVRITKEGILKAYHDGKLDTIPEIPAVTVRRPGTPKTRTLHRAPVVAPPGDGFQAGSPPSAASPQNGANAPVGPGGTGAAGNPPAPDIGAGPVKIDKKLMGERVAALKSDTRDGGSLPATTLSKLSKRPI